MKAAKLIFVTIVFLLLAAILCAHFAVASFNFQYVNAISTNSSASAALVDKADKADAVQNIAEAAVMLTIIIGYTVVGVASTNRIRRIMRHAIADHTDSSTAGRRLFSRIAATTAFVFVTFLLKSAFVFFNACSPPSLPFNCCITIHDVYFINNTRCAGTADQPQTLTSAPKLHSLGKTIAAPASMTLST
jgi:hypothetical protein